MPPAQRANSESSVSSQHRKDTARLLTTMVPGMNAPLVNLCLNYCFGAEAEKKEPRGRRLSSRSSSPSSPMMGGGSSSSFTAGFGTPSLSEPSRFKLRRMDSGPMGEHSLVDPLPGGKDKYGFSNRAESFTFDLKL